MTWRRLAAITRDLAQDSERGPPKARQVEGASREVLFNAGRPEIAARLLARASEGLEEIAKQLADVVDRPESVRDERPLACRSRAIVLGVGAVVLGIGGDVSRLG